MPLCMERYTYLGSCITSEGSVTDNVNARAPKAGITVTDLHRLRYQKGRSVGLNRRVVCCYTAAMLGHSRGFAEKYIVRLAAGVQTM
ncbi:hypothetical protein T265_12050 [Opisthorchis viverrini]|uniref:Uncharacterized protein n=1 Tax=Opisthorchis viverrini TaxID=6198 RepID=A0A074Z716_OPIVI|nr:hypothetical protein T265_12050 [Opisthorchis viverrini]KER19020.1 hypothetical protein T265_12050 [Opisthorchis viverrini]